MPRSLLACFGSKGGSAAPGHHEKHGTSATADVSVEEQKRSSPVFVELFSSQGCATSPVAELLISRLGRGDFKGTDMPPVVVLAFHVDYWDYMGWKDPYGSSQWTVRQKAYVEALGLDTMFTPQIVLQGRTQCVANDESALVTSIKDAPRFPAPTFQASFQKPSAEMLQVCFTGSLKWKVDNYGANVMVALYENGLITDCRKGDNQGRVLSNDFVVRRLEKLFNVKDISAKKVISGTLDFPLWESFNPTKCGLLLFLQNPSHQIFGSQNFDVPEI